MAKVADVFGRLEAFTFSVFLYILGYIQMATSNNVESFAAAQIFYSAGSTGLQILQQIFIADTSDLLNLVFYLSVQPYFYSYLLVVQNKSVTAAGHITQTFSFTSTVASIIISFIIKYTKYYKPFVVAGSLIYLMGIGLMIRYRSIGASTGSIVGTQIAVGIGGGMLNVPAQIGVQASTDHQHVAIATAVFLTCVELGGAVGSAISGAVWSRNIPTKLNAYLPVENRVNATAIYNNINLALDYPMKF
ncbi:putative Siderophore iron transporter mirC [Glarea lozoyensis 74030]|uniref:Putative Siderophore iron transporter mirC n=1 Tax=Glarea lozoyensis (strain ATCC 74030 / MF5533) TaxID=1104152 RepID=H0EWE7_GLAL7|nr:putative Siderophore iron transporter mirC [Glarea lozoyensis 74030]